jgi:hypothetical protein
MKKKYIIKDTSNERREGVPSYVAGVSTSTWSRAHAQRFDTKAEAEQMLRAYAKTCEVDAWQKREHLTIHHIAQWQLDGEAKNLATT